jgi:uncharacterized membrane protein YGL010W
VTEPSAFEWVRRMGVHEAYHLDPTNRLLHWLCIPLELGAALKLLALAPLPFDLSLAAVAAVGTLWIAADAVGGAVMVGVLLGLRALASAATTGSTAADALAAALVFAAAFAVQTRIGHGVFERGVDDTAANLAELARTRNPIPILLIFAYHGFELLFAAGWRPALRARIEAYRAAELARLGDDPRRR